MSFRRNARSRLARRRAPVILGSTARQSTEAPPMSRIPRATTKSQPIVRVVFVDRLEKEMMDLRALRQEVADAETRAIPLALQPLDLPHWRQLRFTSGRLS